MSAITAHDLQDLRRRVLVDQRAVEEADLDGSEVLTGVIEVVEALLDKLNGKPYVSADGRRHERSEE